MVARGRALLAEARGRRSVRDFASDPVPRECVELAVRVAMQAPSGANRQPWHFVIVDDPGIKREIRLGAEAEERENYEGRFGDRMRSAIAHLGTDWEKPFLETVPYLVVVFKQPFVYASDGSTEPNYYVNESVGIACGFFVLALHRMGLATLTHTPSPMGFLNRILRRPPNEKPYILFPVGYPAADARVPAITRKAFEQVVQWNRPG
ncbi:MAG: nitroreductase family protein [Gemmatimonadota bacterium]|nr:nitroreductase family protein [Gemmatimonadota bacterium]